MLAKLKVITELSIDRTYLYRSINRIVKTFEKTTKRGEKELPHSFFIMFKVSELNRVSIMAYNRYRKVHLIIPCETQGMDYSFVVLGKHIQNIVERLNEGRISINCPPSGERIWIYDGASKVSVVVAREEFFPTNMATNWNPLDYFPFSIAQLFGDIDKISYCAGGNNSRIHNMCVNVTPKYLMCTDNVRMSIVPNRSIPCSESFLLPLNSIKNFSHIFEDHTLDLDDGYIRLVENRELQFMSTVTNTYSHAASHLAAGDCPKFESVIPRGDHNLAIVMKDDLVRALEKVRCVVVDDVNACTSLSFSDDEGEGMCLSVDHRNNFAWETIAVNYTGVDLRAKFNLKFLLEAAKCLHTDSIYLKLYGGEECKSLVVTDEKGAHINVLLPLLR